MRFTRVENGRLGFTCQPLNPILVGRKGSGKIFSNAKMRMIKELN